MIYFFHYLPPLLPPEKVEVKKDRKRLVLGVLGVVIIIVVSVIFVLSSVEEPISITDVTVSFSSDKCEIYFILVNSGDIAGFAIIEMYTYESIGLSDNGGSVRREGYFKLGQDRFFVQANSSEEGYMQSERVPQRFCFPIDVNVEIVNFERD